MNQSPRKSKGLALILWFIVWLGMALSIVATGAVVGGVLFPIGGWIFGYDLEVMVMVKNGVFDGAFYALMWGPGISFVVCIMLIRRRLYESLNKDS